MIKSKVTKFFKNLNYRWYIVAVITAVLLVLSLVYKKSLIRFGESVKDLGLSIAYYFGKIFGIKKEIGVSVTSGSKINIFQGTFETFKTSTKSYWSEFSNKANIGKYFDKILSIFLFVSTFGFSFILLIFGVYQICKILLFKENNNIGAKSKLLQFHENMFDRFYHRVITFVQEFVNFVKQNNIWKLWLFIILLYLNIYTIIFEVLAFCFYFFMSFNVKSLGFQGYKLFQDLSIMFNGLPGIFWIVIVIAILHWLRKEFAYKYLNHMEMRNRGFINSLPVVSMVCGTMGKKKTTLITDMSLSQVSIFRHQAKEIMFKIEMKYRDFDFLVFEKWLEKLIMFGSVYSLSSAERVVEKRFKYFAFCICSYNKQLLYKNEKLYKKILWNYDYLARPLRFDDQLQINNLRDDLVTYSKAYLIYITQCYLVSNYSIRLDDWPISKGNRAIWKDDYFRPDPGEQVPRTRFSKVLDFDILRLGKTVIDNNYKSGSFEYGVVTISEFGKERLNQKTSKGIKKDDDKANQMNDYFEYWLKLSRHSSTVAFNPFVKVFSDEQRSQSILADIRELATIVNINDSSERRSSLPFFFIEEFVIDWLIGKFKSFYHNFRYYRGDSTMFLKIIKYIASKLYIYKLRMTNRFSFTIVELDLVDGLDDGKVGAGQKKLYYLMDKKIYSKRFATDVFKKFFFDRSLSSGIGLNDYESYQDIVASFDELKKQNSFFINSINEIAEKGGKE